MQLNCIICIRYYKLVCMSALHSNVLQLILRSGRARVVVHPLEALGVFRTVYDIF